MTAVLLKNGFNLMGVIICRTAAISGLFCPRFFFEQSHNFLVLSIIIHVLAGR